MVDIEPSQMLTKVPPAIPAVLLFGLSHVVALRQAQADRNHRRAVTFNLVVEELLPKFNPLGRREQGRQVLNEAIEPELRRIVEEIEPQIIIAALWADQHFFMSTANLPRRLDFVLPAEPDLALDPAAELVPYDLMREQFRLHCGYLELMVEAARRVARAPLHLLPAPPPVADFGAIPGGSSNKHMDRLVAEHGVAPALLRYKFWRLISDIYNQMAAARGAKSLPVPPECLAPDGFRRAEYNSTDWIHANPQYGELVLKQIDALLAQKAES
jgi:hypothetical protein